MRSSLVFLVLLSAFQQPMYANSFSYIDEEKLKKESQSIQERSAELASFYDISINEGIKEITEDVLQSPLIQNAQKQAIVENQRRIFLFVYPSDGLKIKGLISFVPIPEDYPTLIFLRGGNRLFGILSPAHPLMNPEKYTVISTTYRGGVSEGIDEFGGDDVNDVKHLIDYIPELEQKLHIQIQQNKMFMLGGSRGGMQMFLALARFPEIQSRFKKIVSLSGMLDMRQSILSRPDMKAMFNEDFGLIEGVNEEEWIDYRDPLLAADHLALDLPILIMQGSADNRVTLLEGHHMVEKLQSRGNHVTYQEIEGGTHCLSNVENRTRLILEWLEN